MLGLEITGSVVRYSSKKYNVSYTLDSRYEYGAVRGRYGLTTINGCHLTSRSCPEVDWDSMHIYLPGDTSALDTRNMEVSVKQLILLNSYVAIVDADLHNWLEGGALSTGSDYRNNYEEEEEEDYYDEPVPSDF